MLVSWWVPEVVCSLDANPAWESVYPTKVLSADLAISWANLTKEAILSVCEGVGRGGTQGLHGEGRVAETAKWDSILPGSNGGIC